MIVDQLLGLGLLLVFGLWLALALWVLTAPCKSCREVLQRRPEPPAPEHFTWPRWEGSD